MSKEGFIILEGTVIDVLPESKFRVEIEQYKNILIAYLAGKMVQNRIKVLPGDKVRLEVSPYDLTKGRIIYRYK